MHSIETNNKHYSFGMGMLGKTYDGHFGKCVADNEIEFH